MSNVGCPPKSLTSICCGVWGGPTGRGAGRLLAGELVGVGTGAAAFGLVVVGKPAGGVTGAAALGLVAVVPLPPQPETKSALHTVPYISARASETGNLDLKSIADI